MVPTLTRDDFCRIFVDEMVRLVGEVDKNGDSVRAYAKDVAPSYYSDKSISDEGPEACVMADLDCWED